MAPSATPDIACFVGSPYLGNDGLWHCQGDTVPPANSVQLGKMKLPPFVKMEMLNGMKVDTTPVSPTPSGLPYKNCLRHQAPPNFAYVYNPKNGNCILTTLADAPALQAQLNAQAGTGSGTGTGTAGGDLGSIGNKISAAISEHPFLVLAALGGVAYMIGGRGMKPKSREVVSTTRF